MNTPLVQRLSFRQRWFLALLVLCLPILSAIISGWHALKGTGPDHQLGFLDLFLGLFHWSVTFALTFYIADIRLQHLPLSISYKTLPLALGWSILLRLSALPFVIILFLLHIKLSTGDSVLRMIPVKEIRAHPPVMLALFLALSLMAGLCEELWRVSFLTGLKTLFPKSFVPGWATCGMIGLVAVIFGAAHLYQGFLGVILISVIGLILGLIIIFRKSYWEAAIAHVIFDATSFLGIFLLVTFSPLLANQFVLAGFRGDIVLVKTCVEVGIDVNTVYSSKDPKFKGYKWTCLGSATAQKHLEVMGFLLAHGADPNFSPGEDPPLVQAVNVGFAPGVRLLLSSGAEVNKSRDGFTTALALAAKRGNLEMVRMLMEAGASNREGAEVLARNAKHQDVVDYLESLK